MNDNTFKLYTYSLKEITKEERDASGPSKIMHVGLIHIDSWIPTLVCDTVVSMGNRFIPKKEGLTSFSQIGSC